MGCKAGRLPFLFLGIPIGTNMNCIKSWDPLVEKLKKKMSVWKLKTLSIGGRHTITSNVLGSLGNFWFSLFVVPKTVLKNLESLRRYFFWGHITGEKYIPWVDWLKVCMDKGDGGLGVGSLECMNLGLVGK